LLVADDAGGKDLAGHRETLTWPRFKDRRCDAFWSFCIALRIVSTKLPIDRSVYPAYGFYESRREGKGKVPMPIITKDGQLFTFWEAIWWSNGSPPVGRAHV
jgi:hypothetical protein